VNGTPAHSLTAGPKDGSPIWSSDGKRIAYISEAGPSVIVMQADGTDAQTVFHGEVTAISWSPDGKQLALSGTPIPPPDKVYGDQIYLVPLDGSEPRNLSQSEDADTWPAWSPDGKRIAFLRPLPNSFYNAMYLMNADGSDQHQLTSSDVPVVNVEPDWLPWSPDGRSLLFHEISFSDGTPAANVAPAVLSLDVINVDGTNLRRISAKEEEDIFPRWSPDSQQILFTRGLRVDQTGTIPSIYVMQADGSNVRRLTDGTSPAGSGAWSPDGSHIVYFGGIEQATPGAASPVSQIEVADLFVMNSDGSNPRVVVQNVIGPADLATGIAWRPGTK